jgi:hypothetical protein
LGGFGTWVSRLNLDRHGRRDGYCTAKAFEQITARAFEQDCGLWATLQGHMKSLRGPLSNSWLVPHRDTTLGLSLIAQAQQNRLPAFLPADHFTLAHVSSAAGTVAAPLQRTLVILSIDPARRRSFSAKVTTKILSADATGVTSLKISLRTGDALKTKLNKALTSENLAESTEVSETTSLSGATRVMTSILFV